MRIHDKGAEIILDDKDPRAVRIRAILFEQPSAVDPVVTLWTECSDEHREVLATIAAAGEISQSDLEQQLGLKPVELRGRHGGLARIAKRIAVDYPIQSAGTHRNARRFSLRPEVARQVLRLNTKSPKTRRKP